MPLTSKSSTRFDYLDLLRGVAAILVMLYHYSDHSNLHYLSGAWVAVDLFFVLSGLVIAHSYGNKIISGMSVGEFLKIRIIRLAPLYFIGLLIGVFAALITTNGRESEIFTIAFFSIFLIPYPSQMVWPFGLDFVHGSLFPLNDPAWSLFFELFVNIFFFYFVVKFKKFYNTFFVITFLLFYIFTTLITKQINPGWSYDYMYSGFIRVIYAFFMGTLIYNYHSQKIYNFSVIVPIIMFIAFFSSSTKVAFFNSIVIAPLSVYFLSQLTHKHGIKSKICSILGDISYPIYILHFPIYRLLHPILSLYISTQATIASIFTFILSFISLRIDNSLRLYLKRFTSPATCSLNQTVK